MATRYGTGHWRTMTELKHAYSVTWEQALAEGRAVVGKPEIKPGDRLLVDKQGRYIIEAP